MNEHTRQTALRLLRWYRANGRELPWRGDPTPYRVWVSEVMLQQTSVGTVIPYFERWMSRFPDVESLAAASEREVLAMWEGMGYYARARRLLRAARRIVRDHGGRLPSEEDKLRELPGVGPYIASAVLSFAFGRDVVAIDANLIRVFMRLLGIEGTGAETEVRRRVRRAAEAGLPAGDSAAYNQALMDFGSLICRPRSPRCGECFLRGVCRAFHQGRQYDIPRPSSKRLRKIRTAVAVFTRGHQVYIQRRPREGLFASMWEFPGGKVREAETPRQAVVRECGEELGVDCEPLEKIAELTHYYTLFQVRLHAFMCKAPGPPPGDETHRWVRVGQLDAYPMPSANRQVVQALVERLDVETGED